MCCSEDQGINFRAQGLGLLGLDRTAGALVCKLRRYTTLDPSVDAAPNPQRCALITELIRRACCTATRRTVQATRRVSPPAAQAVTRRPLDTCPRLHSGRRARAAPAAPATGAARRLHAAGVLCAVQQCHCTALCCDVAAHRVSAAACVAVKVQLWQMLTPPAGDAASGGGRSSRPCPG